MTPFIIDPSPAANRNATMVSNLDELLANAISFGYDRAVANLRDGDRRRAWLRENADRWAGYDADAYADYLDGVRDRGDG